MIEPDEKQVWDILGIHPDRMTSYLKVRRKPLKRLSRWMLVAGAFLAVQTVYSLDAGQHLVVERTTIEKPSFQSTHGIKHYTATFVFLTSTGAHVWTVPDNWNNANNKVECIGGGGGAGGAANSGGSGGGGGGAYSSSSNLSFTTGSGVNYTVGAGGAGGVSQNANGTSGSDTWFKNTSTLLAKGGSRSLHSDHSLGSGGSGGASGSGVGSVRRSGGNGGGAGGTNTGGGGGGAGGPNGSGNTGNGYTGSSSSGRGGSGDAGHGGAGGSSGNDGGNGANMGGNSVGSGGGGGYYSGFGTDAGNGGLYGGGGGGAGGSDGFWTKGHAGAKGIIVITYAPLVAPTVTSVSPSTGFTTGGDSITITGSDFTGATGVKFDTTAATDVSVVNSTTITCTNPEHVSGTVDVSVTTPAGTGTGSNAFNYQDTPEPAGVPYIYGI